MKIVCRGLSRLVAVLFSTIFLLGTSGHALATSEGASSGSSGSSSGSSSEKITMVELFTSHGCSSCPPADELLADLLTKYPQLVALEYHVDYWDKLVHGSAGAFKDPFSNSEYTLRQQAYNNRKMTGRAGVYTPQMVINGSYAAVGSQRRYVEHALNTAKNMALKIDVVPASDTLTLQVQIDASTDDLSHSEAGKSAELWLALFDVERTTEITAGENKSLTLVNHHVVRELRSLGQVDIKSAQSEQPFVAMVEPGLSPGQGCAMFVQSQLPGKVLAAANCPSSIWP